MRKILVLPGTMWQVPLMKKIKSKGYELHVINPVKIDEICQLADCFFESDIFDYDKNIAYCKENKIDVVISDECDIATDVVAKLNIEIGAYGISMESAKLFTNKFLMREFCRKYNFSPIPYAACVNKEEVKVFFDNHGPKVIIKPLDSNSSHGVFTVTSYDDVDRFFDEAMSFSRNKKVVLVEKYVEGTEFTVDGIMTDEGHYTLAISEKDHYKHNDNIANSLFFTQFNKEFDYELLRRVNDELLNATQLAFGLTHVEYKYGDGKFYLIEMAARGGGNLISAIIAPFMSGIDNYDYLINKSLDKNFKQQIVADIYNDKRAILKFIDLPYEEGQVKAIHGLNYMDNESAIKSYKLNFNVNDYIYKPDNDSVRLGYYIICAKDKEEFDRVQRNIEEQLIIEIY